MDLFGSSTTGDKPRKNGEVMETDEIQTHQG